MKNAILLLMALLIFFPVPSLAQACSVLNVRTNSCGTVIQTMINGANSGDEIRIINNTIEFNESVSLAPAVNLSSNLTQRPVIFQDGSAAQVIDVQYSNSIIDNLHIKYNGTGASTAIVIDANVNNATIKNSIINSRGGSSNIGISGGASSGSHMIKSNNITVNTTGTGAKGIYLQGNANNISGNNITVIDSANGTDLNVNRHHGILLSSSANSAIQSNAITVITGSYGMGITIISGGSSNNNITSNTIKVNSTGDNNLGAWIEPNPGSGNNLTSNDFTVFSISTNGFGAAIKMRKANDSFITSNNFTMWGYTESIALDLVGNGGLSVSSNTIKINVTTTTAIGIHITGTQSSNFSSNNITAETSAGAEAVRMEWTAAQNEISGNNRFVSNNMSIIAPGNDFPTGIFNNKPVTSVVHLRRNTTENYFINNAFFENAGKMSVYDSIVSDSKRRNYFVNNSMNQSAINFSESSNGNVYVQYVMGVTVQNATGTALSGILITGQANNTSDPFNPTATFNAYTNSSGQADITLSSYLVNATYNTLGIAVYFSNYTYNITDASIVNVTRKNINMTQSQNFTERAIVRTFISGDPNNANIIIGSQDSTTYIFRIVGSGGSNSTTAINCTAPASISSAVTFNSSNFNVNSSFGAGLGITISSLVAGQYYGSLACTGRNEGVNQTATISYGITSNAQVSGALPVAAIGGGGGGPPIIVSKDWSIVSGDPFILMAPGSFNTVPIYIQNRINEVISDLSYSCEGDSELCNALRINSRRPGENTGLGIASGDTAQASLSIELPASSRVSGQKTVKLVFYRESLKDDKKLIVAIVDVNPIFKATPTILTGDTIIRGVPNGLIGIFAVAVFFILRALAVV